MTTEEKAKAYDEAIEKIKYVMDRGVEPILNKADLQSIFPELKESEDEQSKKWILEYLYDGLRKSDEQFKGQFKAAIAWLEKQGEQNPAKCNKEVDFENLLVKKLYNLVYDCAWNKVTCKVGGESQEEYAERYVQSILELVREWADDYIDFTIEQNSRKSYEKGRLAGIKEQKPAEWSEEDEKEVAILEAYIRSGDWSDSHINRALGIVDELTNKLKSLRPQPKKEWSETDKNILDAAIAFVEQNNNFSTWRGIDKHSIVSFLQSFYPQPHWRPSDEQLTALELSIKYLSCQKQEIKVPLLESLYNDLKKL